MHKMYISRLDKPIYKEQFPLVDLIFTFKMKNAKLSCLFQSMQLDVCQSFFRWTLIHFLKLRSESDIGSRAIKERLHFILKENYIYC
jgi:hypothetical protein